MAKPMDNPGRICLECVHCYVHGGHPAYSEYTPATPFEFVCRKKYDIGHHSENTTKESLLEGIRRAERCPDFKHEQP